MNSILIKFPFSSSNDEDYELVLYSSNTEGFAEAMNAMSNDSLFKFLYTEIISLGGSQTNEIKVFEGTLTGDVITEDDSREDVFDPVVTSKLKFNMACKEFPVWLMNICDYYTNIKVMLVAKRDKTVLERWRGYLMANTLNMTVVNDKLSCPLVAVDEIGMAKYIKFKGGFSTFIYSASPSLFDLLKAYWSFNSISTHPANSKFDDLCTLLGVNMNNSLFVARNISYHNDSTNSQVYDILSLKINVEKYFLKRDITWMDILSDVCSYLGVTLYIGSNISSGSDVYILSDTNYSSQYYLNYTFNGLFNRVNSRLFDDYSNLKKVGADLQIDYKPCQWKGVKVMSTPERPPVHSYLDNDNVEPIVPAVGHEQWCEARIGKYNSSQLIDDYEYRVFQYTRMKDKEDQFIPEDHYVTMENCQNAADGIELGTEGYFPYNNGGISHVRPQSDDVDSLDFALTKRGMITARLGTYETLREKISASLKDYFVILNNRWGNLYWFGGLPWECQEYDPYKIATFYPFADDASLKPDNASYLQIDLSAIYLNENIGDDIRVIVNGEQTHHIERMIECVFPILSSIHDWAAGPDARYTGDMTATSTNVIVDMLFQPVIKAVLSIGDWYWDGSAWVDCSGASSLPMFNLRLAPPGAMDKAWNAITGYLAGHIKNYYYEECRPRLGASDNVFRVPLTGVGSNSNPMKGKVKLELFGPVNFVNGYNAHGNIHYNNVLFVLLSDIKIEYTDEAYYADKDIRTVYDFEVDPTSRTKKTKEVKLNLSSPNVDGVFNNCLLYDNGVKWSNLRSIISENNSNVILEEIKAKEMSSVLCGDQVFVELTRKFDGMSTSGIYNVGFTVSGLTEVSGIFMPLTRKFNWTKGTVRWKLQKVAD